MRMAMIMVWVALFAVSTVPGDECAARSDDVCLPPAGMARIPGGTNSGTDPDFGDYSLTVAGFYMDRHEVTQRLWTEVRSWGITNGFTDLPIGSWFKGIDQAKGANHPVVLVNWFDCVKWCNARSLSAGRKPVYYTDAGYAHVYTTGEVATPHVLFEANGYRLPTVDEWEYAARGGERNRRFPWRETDTIQHSRANYNSDPTYVYDTSATAGHHPTYNDGILPYTSPVGSFAPNGFGLYDMAGNVWEWCGEWHPRFPGAMRAFRGGCWHHGARHCRVALINGFQPSYAYRNIGFRCVIRMTSASVDRLTSHLQNPSPITAARACRPPFTVKPDVLKMEGGAPSPP